MSLKHQLRGSEERKRKAEVTGSEDDGSAEFLLPGLDLHASVSPSGSPRVWRFVRVSERTDEQLKVCGSDFNQ